MLEYMRKNANSTVVWLIIGAIAVVFVFFGIGGGGGQYKKITVNGEEVNPGDYDRMVNAVAREQGAGGSYGADRNMKLRAVSELVGQILTNQFGRQLGLEPSDWALIQNIASQPKFQADGRFDPTLYESELSTTRTNKVYYEQATRQEMLSGRLNWLISGLSQVFNPEVLDLFHYLEDQMAFDFIFFPAEDHRAGLSPEENQLTSYYLLNQEKWRRPAEMTAAYVELNPADFLDQVKVGEDELMEAYGHNKGRFTHPESAEISHILLQFPTMNPDAADRQATLERAEAAYERTRTEDFADLARELSDDALSAAKGGAMGQVSPGSTFDNLVQAALTAPLNEVGRPVETDIGYHLIKVTQRREAGVSPFSEAREILENELKAVKARQMAVTKLEDLLIRTETNPKLADAAASMNLETHTSPGFSPADPPAFFDKEQEELAKAFTLPLGKVSTVENENHLVLYSPLSRVESHIPALADIREQVLENWRDEAALELARNEAAEFLERARQNGWESAAEALPEGGRITRDRTPLTRRDAFGQSELFKHSDRRDLPAAINSVAGVGQISPRPVTGLEAGRPGCFALMMSDYQPADEAVLQDQGEMFKMMLSMSRSQLMHLVWRGGLYEAAKENIVVPEEYL